MKRPNRASSQTTVLSQRYYVTARTLQVTAGLHIGLCSDITNTPGAIELSKCKPADSLRQRGYFMTPGTKYYCVLQEAHQHDITSRRNEDTLR